MLIIPERFGVIGKVGGRGRACCGCAPLLVPRALKYATCAYFSFEFCHKSLRLYFCDALNIIFAKNLCLVEIQGVLKTLPIGDEAFFRSKCSLVRARPIFQYCMHPTIFIESSRNVRDYFYIIYKTVNKQKIELLKVFYLLIYFLLMFSYFLILITWAWNLFQTNCKMCSLLRYKKRYTILIEYIYL